jgi:two-component sensor histidine kinase
VEHRVAERTAELAGANQVLQSEVAERQRAEAALHAALEEKIALLKEVHHRVKNNLQVISSLLRLECGQTTNPEVQATFQSMQGRVRSMASIHEHLYHSANLAQVDMAAYLEHLCAQLFHALVASPGSVRLRLDVAPLRLGIDQAVPCGLLVNELVSNALKHAFPGERAGEVWVELQPLSDGPALRLRVADNGVGLPAKFDLKGLKSLGLELVDTLARQLHGALEIGPGPGAEFLVVFSVESDSMMA